MKPKIKWISWAWFFLTLFFLFFRLQNLQGVFTPEGVIINDTDPYYRLHRVETMLKDQHFYPLYEDHLNFPEGINVSWPLGLDLLVSLPLQLYHSTSRAEIASFCAIIIPFLSLPLLWFAGWLGTYLGGPLIGLLLGLLVTCSSTLIYQTGLGRFDHHFLESMLPVVLLMFLLKFMQKKQRFLSVGIVLILGLAPSFVPHGWFFGMLMAFGFLADRKWEKAHEVSKLFFYSFLLSLIPLSFCDKFFTGEIQWGSFSWWSPWSYILAAMMFEIIHRFFYKAGNDRRYQFIVTMFFAFILSFLIYKNQNGFLHNNINGAINTVGRQHGTMASTVEARSPFSLSWDIFIHSDMHILIVTPVCFLFFLFRSRYLFILGYSLVPILLSFLQLRFMTISLPLMFIVLLLFLKEWIDKIRVRDISKKIILGIVCVVLIIPFRPFFGLTDIQNLHYYFQPVRKFCFFLNNDFKQRNEVKQNQAIIAHWDYGHWLLYYTGLPVIADPFQGPAAMEVLRLFTSKGTNELKPFLKRHPSKYLVIESGALRSLGWIETVGMNKDLYFEKSFETKGETVFKTTEAFENLFMYRFFFELGRGIDNNHPKNWRLIYISPYSSPGETSISALKAFEFVPGLTIHAHSLHAHQKLYLQGEVNELKEALVFQQEVKGVHDFTWTVPYGIYDRGGVSFNGSYVIRDENGNDLYKLSNVTEEQILRGDTIRIRF